MVEDENNLGFTDFPPLIASFGKEGAGTDMSNKKLEMVLHGKDAGGSDSVASNPNAKEWRTLFPSAKPITPQPPMKFFPSAALNGKRVVDYAAGDFSAGIKRCEDYVVGFCVGKRLSFPAVKDAVIKHWKLKNEVSIKLHSNCAFIFEFKEDEDRKKVLELGSFYISSCLFTVRPWSNLIESSIASIRTLPIWVLIYNVPLHMWDNEGLSLISSFLGRPILADDYTLNRTRLSYARVCIEVDVDFDYPVSIPLMIDGKIALEMPVEYQWKPPKCALCKVFGHSSSNCTKKWKPRWSTKKNGNDLEKSQPKAQGDSGNKNEGSVDTQVNVGEPDGGRVSTTVVNELHVTKVITGGIATTKAVEQVSADNGVDKGINVAPTEDGSKQSKNTASGCKKIDGATEKNGSASTSATTRIDGGKMSVGGATEKVKVSAPVIKSPGKSETTVVQKIAKEVKHNPFVMLSDFPYKSQCRFPVDSRKISAGDNIVPDCTTTENRNAAQSKNNNIARSNDNSAKVSTNNTFSLLSNEEDPSSQDKDIVTIEECEDVSDGLSDVESDKYNQPKAYENKTGKKTEKERSRLKWNGNLPDESMGKGQRSAARKYK